jgi:hypothetical protein
LTTDSIYEGPYNGYSTFDEISNATLRAWNRLNVVFNIKEILRNNAMAVNYVKQFDKKDQIAIAVLAVKITKNGYENTRREIMKANNV